MRLFNCIINIMAPHSYIITVTKDDFNETFTENSFSKVFLRLKKHIALTDTSTDAFRMKYITRKTKHENFTIQVTDRDKIDVNESKKASNRRKYQRVQNELKELEILRKRVAQLEEELRMLKS